MKIFKKDNLRDVLAGMKDQPVNEAFLKLLREQLISYMEKTPIVKNADLKRLIQQRSQLLFNFRKIKTMPIAFALGFILLIAGGGTAAVAASLNSLPGDALYPVKILSEDTRLAFTFNPDSEIKLRMNLAQKRVEEVSKLIDEAKSNTSIGEDVDKLESSFSKALNNFDTHLDSVSDKVKEFKDEGSAEKAFKAKEELKAAITAYKDSLESRDGDDDKIGRQIKRAVKLVDESEKRIEMKIRDIEEDEDNYVKSAGVAISAKGKIGAAENKIISTERFINKISEKFGTSTVALAKEKLESAKNLFSTAKSNYEAAKYEESFSQAKEAIKKASEAKIMAEIILKVDFDGRSDDYDDEESDNNEKNRKNDNNSNSSNLIDVVISGFGSTSSTATSTEIATGTDFIVDSHDNDKEEEKKSKREKHEDSNNYAPNNYDSTNED